MALFRKKPDRLPSSDLADRLRGTARRLRGWTVEGTSGVDVEALLNEAADAIADLEAAKAALASVRARSET